MKRIGFSLSGGGAKGVAHAGFLKAMEENNITPDIITGCSMGAVVGGCYACGVKIDHIIAQLTSLRRRDILDIDFNFVRRKSMFSGKKIQNMLQANLGDKDISELKIKFGCTATDLISGKLVEFTDGNIVDAVLASCAIPTIFAPVKKDDKLLVDGGVLERNPIKLAKKLGADVVVGVDVLGKKIECREPNNLMEVGMRAFSVIDYVYCNKSKPDLMIYPDTQKTDMFSFTHLKDAYQSGYNEGIKSLDKIKKLLA